MKHRLGTTLSSITLLALAAFLSGCGSTYYGVASHTLSVGPNQTADVVWVRQDGDRLFRCTNTQQGPACFRVQMQ